MPSPPISLFMTTIASQPVLRKKQEYVLRILQAKKIPFTTYDLASDQEAKRMWRRKAPSDKQQLPGMLIGGKFPGTVDDFEDAVEHDELAIFLRLNESWDPLIDEDRPMPVAKPVGIPGAYTPLEMTPEHLRAKVLAGTPSPSPLSRKTIPVNKRTDFINVGEDLSEFGLSGVQATMDELKDLLSELGLEGDAAGDLAKGLSNERVKPLKFSKKPDDNKPTPGPSDSKVADPPTPEPAKPKSEERVVEDTTEEANKKTDEQDDKKTAHLNKETKEEIKPSDVAGSDEKTAIEVTTTAEVIKIEEDIKAPNVEKVEVEIEAEPASIGDTKAETPKMVEEVDVISLNAVAKTAMEKIEELPSKQVPDIDGLVPEETAAKGK